jgi:SAM-dependent methyltransferase
MDAQGLEFPEATFDAAFCIFAFFFFPDRARAFRELHRVLKPGGRALIATWGPIERRPIMRVAFEAVAEVLPHVPRPTKGDLQDPAECVREMTEAGFRDVQAQVFTSSTHFESAEAYVDLMVRSGAPFAVMRKKVSDGEWSSIRARLIEAVSRRFPNGGADLSAEAILTFGTR